MNAAPHASSRGPNRRMRPLTLTLMSMVIALFVVSSARASAGNSLNAKACQKGGWTNLVTSTGATFRNEDACVAYGAKGGVVKRGQTISFTSANPSTVTVGATYTPTASATSGLPVAIALDAASSTACSRSGVVVTFNAAGTCTIDAKQAGNATYNAATQVQQSISVVRRAQTISFTSANPSPITVDGTYTPTASATSLLPVTITVDPASATVCSQSGAVVTVNAAGTCTLDAGQAGDATYNPAAQVQQSITVTIPVDPSQATCESWGGTFGAATSLWTCKGIPDAPGQPFMTPLLAQCVADGGVAVGAIPTGTGTWDATCLATAVDVLLFVVGAAVAGAIIAASSP